MSEVFSRHMWLLKHLGVGGGKIYRFGIVQFLVWTNCLSLAPAVFGDSAIAVRCMILACALVSAGSGFKLTQLRRHAALLTVLLDELKGSGGTTPMLLGVKKVSKVYVTFILSMLCAWLAFPWLRGEPVLPLDYWTPFTIDSFIPFCSVYGFASLGLIAVAYTQEAVDTLLLLLAAYICRRLDRIEDQLEEIGDEDIFLHYPGKTNEDLFRAALAEHAKVIRLIRAFDKLVSDIFLVQVLQSTIVSTMCFYSASKIHELKEIPKFLVIACATYMQLYIYCWFGEEISEHSNGLHRAVYQSKWYQCNLVIKKDVNIFQTFTKHHFKLKGGHIFAIHLQTFLQMIRESFSAFMVLRAVAK